MTAQQLTDAFEYLDRLRDRGTVNMWGAAPYLRQANGLSKEDAESAHLKWMDTFDGDASAAARAERALANG